MAHTTVSPYVRVNVVTAPRVLVTRPVTSLQTFGVSDRVYYGDGRHNHLARPDGLPTRERRTDWRTVKLTRAGTVSKAGNRVRDTRHSDSPMISDRRRMFDAKVQGHRGR